MSRSGYSDDYGDDDPFALGRWRAAVESAMRGRRGQAFLREILTSLDALPDKEPGAKSFVPAGGPVCTLGSVAMARGLDVSEHEPEEGDDDRINTKSVAATFGIANAMACEIMYMNDDVYGHTWKPPGVEGPLEKPEHARWRQMRAWVARNIRQPKPEETMP